MMRLMRSIAVLALVSMACSAPGGSGSSESPTGSPADSNPSGGSLRPVTPDPASPGVGSPGTGSGSLSPAIVDPIVADAAARADVAVSEVIVVSAEPVTWPDGGLGCPLPGMVYTQVIVDGYQVIVQAGQQTFDYRGSSAGKFRLCTPA
jgi:hypothetical protein